MGIEATLTEGTPSGTERDRAAGTSKGARAGVRQGVHRSHAVAAAPLCVEVAHGEEPGSEPGMQIR